MVGVHASRLKDTMFVFKNHRAFTRPLMLLQKLIYFSQISFVGVPLLAAVQQSHANRLHLR